MQRFGVIQGGPGPGQPPSEEKPTRPVYLSLRDYIESYIETYRNFQSSITLDPIGTALANQTITVQPNVPQYSALIVSLIIDTVPSMTTLTSATSAYSFAAFGNPGATTQFILTPEWLNKNLINPSQLALIGQPELLSLIFSNRSSYTVEVTVTTVVGMILSSRLNEILKLFGKREIGA